MPSLYSKTQVNTGTGGNPSEWIPGIKTSYSAADNRDIIMEAMIAATAVRGVVSTPSAAVTYKCRTIFWNSLVGFRGLGDWGTWFEAVEEEPLIVHEMPESGIMFMPNPAAGIQNIGLWGNNIGTVAMDIKANSYYNMRNIKMLEFSQKGINANGVILGTWDDINVKRCPIGMEIGRHATPVQYPNGDGSIGGEASMPSWFLSINNSRFQNCATRGIIYNDGAGLTIHKGDFEFCGTPGNSNTGIIKATGATHNPGVTITNMWAERNSGTLLEFAGQPSTSFVVKDSQMTYSEGTNVLYGKLGMGVYDFSNLLLGVAGSTHPTNSFTLDGRGCILKTDNVNYRNVTKTNGATHLDKKSDAANAGVYPITNAFISPDTTPVWETQKGSHAVWPIDAGDKTLTITPYHNKFSMRISGCAGQVVTLVMKDVHLKESTTSNVAVTIPAVYSFHSPDGIVADATAKTITLPASGSILVDFVKVENNFRVELKNW